ncbi:MAG: FG-GAP-like repeat-containing protein [Candidatus Magnetobacterium sp. LHC-1]|nr:VCBS repeat-containing protein [Nitrospirota bacterium]
MVFSVRPMYADGNFTLTVIKNGQSVGSVWSAPKGIDCGSMCKNPYPSGTEVTLNPIPTLDSTFAGWSGCDSIDTNDPVPWCKVKMSSDRTVTATFNKSTAAHVKLDVKKSGDGSGMIQSYPPGMDCGSRCDGLYPQGAKVRLMPMPYSGSTFGGWSGCDANNATPGPTPTPGPTSTPGPSQSPPPPPPPKSATLSGPGNPNECTITMSSDKTVTATFSRSTSALTLTVSKAGDGSGMVMSNPPGMECGSICNGPYPKDAVTMLMAKAGPLSTFVSWSGCDADSDNTVPGGNNDVALCKVTMSSDKTVTATFSKNTTPGISLFVHTVGSGTGSVSSLPSGISCSPTCTTTYDANTLVTLVATAGSDSVFSIWSGCDNSDSSTSAKCKVTLANAKLVTATFVGSNSVVHKVPHDYDGDGKSDLLWHNQATGTVAIWLMDGDKVKGIGSPDSAGLDWEIEAEGDFNGDGKTDILFRNKVDGSLHIWFMSALTIANHAPVNLVRISNRDWYVKAVGDFNGDDITDILFRDKENGMLGIWSMRGADFIDARFTDKSPGMDWEVAAVADFDGDGKDDIFFRSEGLGAVALWLMNGPTIKSATLVSSLNDPKWLIVRAGDFDGDGKADILYRNVSTGEIGIWFMYGPNVESARIIATVTDDSWQIIKVGDYDGGGMLDLLWQNVSTGQLYVWFMNGATIKGKSSLGTMADSNWFVVSN